MVIFDVVLRLVGCVVELEKEVHDSRI